ncbi:MAG TPA: hypothetical protein VGG64_28970 [Pirellulales bacterium]
MTQQQQLHNSVMRHLHEARNSMRKLMASTGDWTAKVEVECVLRDVEEVWERFAQHQLFINHSRH